jgi:phenylacetate-CoA ligase
VSRYQIVVDRRENRDEMMLKLELTDESADKTKLADRIGRKFQDTCRVKPDSIEFAPAGAIADNQPRVVDARKWE